MSLKGWGPGGVSGLDDGDGLGFVLAAMGCGVLHISSSVSSLMGGGYWAESSSYDVLKMSLCLGGCMPGARFVGTGVTVMRRISSFVGTVGVAWFGRGLHRASNTPGP